LKEAQKQHRDIGCTVEWLTEKPEQPHGELLSLKSAETKTLWYMWKKLSITDGVLKRKFNGSEERWQIILPQIIRKEFMEIVHSGMTGGHLGFHETAAAIQARAYWPAWSTDLRIFLKSCEPCAQYHRGTIRHQAMMQTPLIGEPWQRVLLDITGPHRRSSHGNQYILTLVDHFTKWAKAIPIRNHTAPVVARALMIHVFFRNLEHHFKY